MPALQAAFKDKNTQGVILRINSPGGSPVQAQHHLRRDAAAAQEVPGHPALRRGRGHLRLGRLLRRRRRRPIYVAKASIVGSIGVLMDGFGFTGLMDKLGVERRLITAGENKGMLDPFSPVDPKDVQHARRCSSTTSTSSSSAW